MDDWRALNRANWDERVAVHRRVPYGNGRWEDGSIRLNAIEEAELGAVAGLRVLHLQCHFGQDSLILARRGADVTGVDFSAPAIAAARADSARLGIPARFIEADLYAAPAALGEAGSFDLVYTTWGTICWLPDIIGWAGVVAHFLKPGGRLYLADLHPVAAVLDDSVPGVDGRPGWFAPYFGGEPLLIDDASDYADGTARLVNSRTVQFIHPLGGIVGALLGAGLRIEAIREHPGITWQQFSCLVQDELGLWRWPDRDWVPLAVTMEASRV
jgi:SAM-dependent methyltransferase